jgi:hypothetical protein
VRNVGYKFVVALTERERNGERAPLSKVSLESIDVD